MRPAEAALVVLAAALASLVYTYPLVFHLKEAIPYATGVSPERRVQGLVPGDHLQFFYFLSLADDMVHGRASWFRDAYEFSAPEPPDRRLYFFLPFSLLFAVLAPLGRATAYNLLILASFPATALAGYLLARRIDAGRAGAAVAAAAIALLPYRVANLAGGHPTGLAFLLLPLGFYCLEVAWQEGRRAAAFGAGLCHLGLALNEPHFAYFFALLLPVWLLFAILRGEPSRPARELGAALGWVALAALGPAVVFVVYGMRHEIDWSPWELVLLYLVVASLLAIVWRLAAELRARAGDEAWSAEARSYAPLALLALYALQLRFDVPHFGKLVVSASLLATLAGKRATASAARRAVCDSAERWRALWPFAIGFGIAVLSLLQYKTGFIDPAGHGGGRALREIKLFSPRPADFLARSSTALVHQIYPGITVAALALAGLVTREGKTLAVLALLFFASALGPNAPDWLPLYRTALGVLPFFGIIRQPAKLFAIGATALALGAGLGVGAISARLSGRGRALLACVAVAAVAIDFASLLPLGVSRLETENRAYDAVAESARGSNLLELPIWPGDSAFSSIYQYWTTRTRVPIVNGYSPTTPADYITRVYRPLETMNVGELSEEQSRLLDDFRVRFVTIHRDTFPGQVSLFPYRYTLAVMRENPNLRRVVSDGGVHLFERVEGPYKPWVNTARWMGGVFFEAESLKQGAGERVPDESASGGAFMRGRPGGGTQPIVYGPYRPLPAGAYEVRFRARGKGRVEVAADLGKTELATAPVERSDWGDTVVRFASNVTARMELRGWPAEGSGATLDLDWMLVRKLAATEDASPGPRRFEAEELTALSGSDHEAADASGNAYAAIVAYAAPPGTVVRDGPYRLYEPGRIDLVVRFRGGPLRLHVESADGRRRYSAVALPREPVWSLAEASFDLDERSILCTRLVSDGGDAAVDYVEIDAKPRG